MHLPQRSLRALGAALAAGALLAAASTAHAAPRTLNPQPEPPGIAQEARTAAVFDGTEHQPSTLTFKRAQTTDMSLLAGRKSALAGQPPKLELGALKAGASEVLYDAVTVTFDDIQRLNA